jgi:hypothetical protein
MKFDRRVSHFEAAFIFWQASNISMKARGDDERRENLEPSLKKEAVGSSKILTLIYKTPCCNISEDGNVYSLQEFQFNGTTIFKDNQIANK